MTPKSKALTLDILTIDTKGQTVREEMDPDHVAELSLSIQKHGLLCPITVRPGKDEHYVLLAGAHRLAACAALGWTHIPATIIDGDDTPQKGVALVENITRKQMSLREEVDAVGYLYQDEQRSPSQICEILNKSRAWVDRRLMLPHLPIELQAVAMDGSVPLSHIEEIARIPNEGSRNYLIATTISSKLPLSQVRALVDVYLSSPSIPEAVDKGVESAKKVETQKERTHQCFACGAHHDIRHLMAKLLCNACANITTTPPLLISTKGEKDNGHTPGTVGN